MNTFPSRGLLVAAVALATFVGCAKPTGPVRPGYATGPRMTKPMAADPMSGADQPGALYDNALADATPESVLKARAANQPIERVSRIVDENVTAPGALPPPTTIPATAPATGPATQGASAGVYYTIGGVVAEVNGVPIYANKVLHLVEPILAARAKELNAQQFKAVASNEIRQQMFALRNLELEYAAAERNLDQKDKDLADALTSQWRQRQITATGGSIELARKNAPEIARRERLNPNASFDELCTEMYRVFMSRVYYEKKIMPRIQISASEMREYYDRNRDSLFAKSGVAQLRLIKIDVKKSGGRDAALAKITALRNRIVKAGEPFESIASSVNDNALLLKTGGSVKVDQGAFAVKEVDDAVWATAESQVTEIIDAGDAFYIAQVLEKQSGEIKSFDDEAIQQRIADDLRSRDFRDMRKRVQEQLEQDAVIRSDPSMMNTAIEMAMQNYPRWSGK